MYSMPIKPWLPIVAMAAVLTCPLVSQAEPADRERGARQKEQRAEPRGAQLRDHNREREPRPAPPRLRSPSERPAPDAHRPPRVRSDDRERRPRWDDDDRRRRHDRSPQHWPDDRRWNPPPHHHYHYRHPPRYRWGHHVPSLGPRAHLSLHFGERYWFDDGYWYTPGRSGFVVVRPPVGVYLNTLPVGYTLVRVGPSVYYHANGVYYTEAPSGGYQVAQVQDDEASSYQPPMVYPARGQSAEQQRSDEYECHGWAVDRAGFDPTLVPLGQGPEGDAVLRGNYQRALTACLEGRGYTVK